MAATALDPRLVGSSSAGAARWSPRAPARRCWATVRAVAWLANALAQRGLLEAGDMVIAGATPARSAAAGDTFSAEFDRLGRVEVRCA